MNKKLGIYSITFISSVIFFTFCNINVKAFTGLPCSYNFNYINDIYDVVESKLIAEIPSSNIKLYYLKDDKDFGMYRGFILQKNDKKRYYSWENVDGNLTYAPKMTLADLNMDGKEEIIIELCKGYGTGIYDGEVHVIEQVHFDEILVENPTIIVYKNVTTKELPNQFEIILNSNKIVLEKKGMLTPPYSNVGIGWSNDNKSYEVKNNKLYAKVRLAVDMIVAGEFIIKYKYEDSIFQMESIDFKTYK